MALLPIILTMLVFGVWGIIGRIKRDYSDLKTKGISSMVILLFLIHPNIVTTMFSTFQYLNLNNVLVARGLIKKNICM